MAIEEEVYSTIVIGAKHNRLKIKRNATATTDSINTLKIRFEFETEDWKGLAKAAVFQHADDYIKRLNDRKYMIPLDGINECSIPYEVLESAGNFMVGVYGITETERLTSNFLMFKIDQGCYCIGATSVEPVTDIYAKILLDLKKKQDALTAGENIVIEGNIIKATIPDEYATKDYVSENGGKIDKITVNGNEQPIVDKTVDIEMPTKVSEFENDLGYLTSHQDISSKVDKIEGKQLSTEDYTTEEKEKLDRIEAGAQVNVQPDWSQNDEASDNYIQNRPFYDEVISTDISGAEYTISGFTSGTFTVIHDAIPLELGQVWDVLNNVGNVRKGLPVQENEDGELYIGTPTVDDVPFYIRSTQTKINSSYQAQNAVARLTLTCVSGAVTTTVPKKIDMKYLPGIQIHEINKDGSMSNQDFLNLANGYYYMYSCPPLNFDCVVRVLDGAWAIYDTGEVYGGLHINDDGNIDYDMRISLDGFGADDFERIFPQNINAGQTLIATRSESGMVYKPVDFPIVPTKLSELENDLNVVINITVGNNITSDMTYSEIMKAYRAGKNVTAQVRYLAGGGFIAKLTNTINYLEFTASTGQSIQISTDDSIYIDSSYYVSADEIVDTLRYTDQTLTDEQKSQARNNIGAMSNVIDSTLNTTSENPVQNKVISEEINKKMNKVAPTGEGALSINRKSGTSIGYFSAAIGYDTTSSGTYSFAEGRATKATGEVSHAEGYSTTASGMSSHAEGDVTKATGNAAHSEGYFTIAAGQNQHAQGKYNIEDTDNKYAHIVGNGNSNTRSNAHTLDWSGNAWFAGNVYVGGTGQDDTNAKEVATKEDIDLKIASLVDSSPETLDTLNELASALGNDPNFATTMVTELGKKITEPIDEGASGQVLMTDGNGGRTWGLPNLHPYVPMDGEWGEPLVTYTMTEDARRIIISKTDADIEFSTLALKEILVKMVMVAGEGSSANNAVAAFWINHPTGGTHLTTYNAHHKDAARTNIIYASTISSLEQTDEYPCSCFYQQYPQNNGANGNHMWISNKNKDRNIYQIVLDSASDTNIFGAGSIIKIWGR